MTSAGYVIRVIPPPFLINIFFFELVFNVLTCGSVLLPVGLLLVLVTISA